MVIVFHRINETYIDCEICRSKQCMEKILSTPTIKKQNKKDNKKDNKKVGELTKEYIEMNRKILEKEKLKRDPNDTP
jgi:hypothetical protein